MNNDPTVYALSLMVLGIVMVYYSIGDIIGPIPFIFGELCIAIGISVIVFIFLFPNKKNKG